MPLHIIKYWSQYKANAKIFVHYIFTDMFSALLSIYNFPEHDWKIAKITEHSPNKHFLQTQRYYNLTLRIFKMCASTADDFFGAFELMFCLKYPPNELNSSTKFLSLIYGHQWSNKRFEMYDIPVEAAHTTHANQESIPSLVFASNVSGISLNVTLTGIKKNRNFIKKTITL